MCRSCWSRARVLLVMVIMLGQGMPAGNAGLLKRMGSAARRMMQEMWRVAFHVDDQSQGVPGCLPRCLGCGSWDRFHVDDQWQGVPGCLPRCLDFHDLH